MIARVVAIIALAAFAAAADEEMVCLPSAPSAAAGTSVVLNAWNSGREVSPKYEWTVSAGSVRSENGVTTWDLKGVHAGTANADVNAIVNGAKVASCSLELRVYDEHPDAKRTIPQASPSGAGGGVATSGRAFLVSGGNEGDGFGLYSYLLIGAPPSAADRNAYLAVFEAALRLMRPVGELSRALKSSQLNATFIPVKKSPDAEPDPQWLVNNYDYSAGTEMLVRAGIRGNASGVYIVSVRAPLSRGSPAPPFLVQDLSHVPPSLASTWVTLFINQAAQERFWNTNTIDGLVAKLRLAIAVTAEGVPSVKNAIATWISISK
jgi:hypothetical protein